MIDYTKLIRKFGQSNELIAKSIANVKFKNITDEEWDELLIHANGPLGILIQKFQDQIFAYYAQELIERLMTNKVKVDASIYGGLLNGLSEGSFRVLCEEARHRQKNRKNNSQRNNSKL